MKNTEETNIRYPFHGFYRKLLRDEGYAGSGPVQQPDQDRVTVMQHTALPTIEVVEPPVQQMEVVEQTQTTLTPADTGTAETETVTCDAVQEDVEQAPRYVADVIGNDFKTWGPGLVAIEASTGTGKTTFVLNNVLQWCQEEAYNMPTKRVFYLTNRNALRDEINGKVEAMKQLDMYDDPETGDLTCTIDNHELFKCVNYQNYEVRLKNGLQSAIRRLKDYHFIVCDEAHYFVDDASFNPNTGLMYDLLMQLSKYTTVIFMTATPGFMFKSWCKQGKLDKNRDYCLYRKSDWITKAVVYQEDQLKAILDAIPADEEALVFVKRIDRLNEIKSWYGDDAGCYCSKNNSEKYDELEDCIKDGKLQRHIVAATQVLYNGIDIKDPMLKHIIVEDYEPTKVVQEIGRKRQQGAADNCTVYFRELTPREYSGLSGWNKNILEVVEAVWKLKRGDERAWEKLLKKKNADRQIDNAISKKYISYSHVTNIYDTNRMLLERLREESAELDKIKTVGYWRFMQEDVWGKILNVEPQRHVPQALIDYIKNNMNLKLCKADIQNRLVDAGLCAKAQSIKKLNVLLESFEVEIASGTEWGRKSTNYGKVVYWLQER